ncbi:MAG: galactokinase [Acidobacteriota bacterium]|nr:galactokinase [Acidobacteriota bacterium]
MSTATGVGHGRLNLIGEHTDYNGGLALPLTLPIHTIVDATVRGDWRLSVRSDAEPHAGQQIFEAAAWVRAGDWTDYATAASALMAREGIFEHGAALAIRSNVPIGAGLASSAALCVALVRALAQLGGVTLDPMRVATLARAIETDFVGVPVGLMDQLAAAGEPGVAQLIDFRDVTAMRIAIPPRLSFEVIDSGIAHENRSGGYALRRRECEEAAAMLGVASLREIDEGHAGIDTLPEPHRRRVRHVVSENARVRAAVEALARADIESFGQLVTASHRSLRDDYDVSLPAIDAIVERAIQSPGVLGARLMGGGFGGAVLSAKRQPL